MLILHFGPEKIKELLRVKELIDSYDTFAVFNTILSELKKKYNDTYEASRITLGQIRGIALINRCDQLSFTLESDIDLLDHNAWALYTCLNLVLLKNENQKINWEFDVKIPDLLRKMKTDFDQMHCAFKTINEYLLIYIETLNNNIKIPEDNKINILDVKNEKILHTFQLVHRYSCATFLKSHYQQLIYGYYFLVLNK